MSEVSENALDTTLKNYILDNRVDGIAKQINKILLKISESESSQDMTSSKWILKLRKLIALACHELEIQSKDITECIQFIETDLKNRPGRTQKRRKREASITKEFNAIVHSTKDIPCGAQVAAKIARSHDLWILASVVQYVPQSDSYEIEDEDSGDEGDGTGGHRHHVVQSKYIIPLSREGDDSWIKYPLHSRVLAMYPNTTSFYPATVTVPNPKGFPNILLKFDDDDDETGKIPDRKVPFRFVVSMPTWLHNLTPSRKMKQ